MIYLDNAATTFPKPQCVIDAVTEFMQKYGGNPGRGGHYLSDIAAEKVLECREEFASLIGTGNPERIIFTKNTTEAINLAIKGTLKKGDEIIKEYPLISPGEVRKITFLDVVEEFFSSLVKNDKE